MPDKDPRICSRVYGQALDLIITVAKGIPKAKLQHTHNTTAHLPSQPNPNMLPLHSNNITNVVPKEKFCVPIIVIDKVVMLTW
jgi:hypothetical protein